MMTVIPANNTARPDGHPYVIVEPPHVPAAAEGPGPHPSGRLLIVAGAGTPDAARLASFAAYYRLVKRALQEAVEVGAGETYPEPVDHCDICRWWKECGCGKGITG